MGKKQRDPEEASIARDFCMARLAACRSALQSATDACDEAVAMLVDPDEDPKGTKRAELLELIDEEIGSAAARVQSAQTAFEDVDPKEAEPEPEDDEEDGDDEEEDEDDEDGDE